jgi:GT2 family glycosyltransferase
MMMQTATTTPTNQLDGRPTRVAVILACFNRRETTLRCLAGLLPQERQDLHLPVYLMDDASTDGTARAVAEHFPKVHILHGTGSRYWCGGMHDAMQAALADDFDFMLLLNDDVELLPDAMQRMLDAHSRAVRENGAGPHIIVGAFVDPTTHDLTYSGIRRPSRFLPTHLQKIPPDPVNLVSCDTLNGNCVLIPAAVVERIGVVDDAFTQLLGDLDYGYRATAAGAKIWIVPSHVGTCAMNEQPRKWANPSLSVLERWRILNHPKVWPLRPWLRFMWRHGRLTGLASLAVSYAKALAGR